MLLKTAGCFLLLAAASAVGYLVAAAYTRRPAELRQLQSALQMLETEIGYGATPLPEAFYRISRLSAAPVGTIFAAARDSLRAGQGMTAGEAWVMAVRQVYGATALTETDRTILEDFGASLGASDRTDQLKHLHLTREQLRQEELKASESAGRQARLWLYLGPLSGLALCIIII